jgi:hypothetical protein
MISLFIDDELSIKEKLSFIQKVRGDTPFYNDSLYMLQQEVFIRADVVDRLPCADIRLPKNRLQIIRNLLRPATLIPATVACIILLLIIMPSDNTKPSFENRFIIYRPDVNQVEIVGSFTDWKRIPLQKISNSGYWEGIFKLSEGEHRYTYILGGDKHFTDPTVMTVEKDDFGGTNSIIRVGNRV